MTANPLNPTGNPHALYRYTIGSTRNSAGGYSGSRGEAAAKCKCGAQLVGEDDIRKHQTIQEAWRTPPAARATDPSTSHQAAERTIGRQSQMITLLRAYAAAADGLTNEEAGLATGLADDPTICYWKRCSELLQMEYIAPRITDGSVKKRMSRSGRRQRVNAITATGTMLLDYMDELHEYGVVPDGRS